ncbi:MAG: acetyl-CoA carboxylase biotin carboxyl carrier protein [Pirellulaceae bacterium]|nr:acetyl-CoA carboxylase biotin carboxyl carrier protein [Pirellulaceae bacterium]
MSKGNTHKEDVFSVERIRSLIDLMKEYDLSEVDLKQDEQQIRLVRGAKQVVSAAPAIMAAAPAPAPVAAAAAPAGPVADGPHIKIIKSPMVGTFYARPNPKSDDFVKVGSAISADTVVCIIEAMKVFNDIPAEVSGKIVEILVKNEEAVDFERPLFKVDTRG